MPFRTLAQLHGDEPHFRGDSWPGEEALQRSKERRKALGSNPLAREGKGEEAKKEGGVFSYPEMYTSLARLASSTVSTALDSLDSSRALEHPRQSRQSRQCCQAVKLDNPSTVVDNPSTAVDTYRQLSTVSTVSTARAQPLSCEGGADRGVP